MVEEDLSAADIRNIATDMNRSASSLQALLENLLHWSRLQREDVIISRKAVSLKAAVDRTLELLSQTMTAKQQIVRSAVSESIFVFADENMLHTILRNLLSNAMKFTPDGGIISIKTLQDSSFVSVKVSDTGIGIPAEMISQLYSLEQKPAGPAPMANPAQALA